MSAKVWNGIVSVPRSHMELLSNFSATWGRADGPNFGIHCATCGQDVQASNGIADDVLRVSCGCTEYVSDRFTAV